MIDTHGLRPRQYQQQHPDRQLARSTPLVTNEYIRSSMNRDAAIARTELIEPAGRIL